MSTVVPAWLAMAPPLKALSTEQLVMAPPITSRVPPLCTRKPPPSPLA